MKKKKKQNVFSTFIYKNESKCISLKLKRKRLIQDIQKTIISQKNINITADDINNLSLKTLTDINDLENNNKYDYFCFLLNKKQKYKNIELQLIEELISLNSQIQLLEIEILEQKVKFIQKKFFYNFEIADNN